MTSSNKDVEEFGQSIERPDSKSTRASKKTMHIRKHRFTVHLPIELIERIRNASYWMPGYTLTRLSEEAYISFIEKLEKKRGEPFPMREGKLREGRPPRQPRRTWEPDEYDSDNKLEREGFLKPILDTDELAEYLGISKYLVYRLVKAGEIPHCRIGRCIRFRIQDIEDFLVKIKSQE